MHHVTPSPTKPQQTSTQEGQRALYAVGGACSGGSHQVITESDEQRTGEFFLTDWGWLKEWHQQEPCSCLHVFHQYNVALLSDKYFMRIGNSKRMRRAKRCSSLNITKGFNGWTMRICRSITTSVSGVSNCTSHLIKYLYQILDYTCEDLWFNNWCVKLQ